MAIHNAAKKMQRLSRVELPRQSYGTNNREGTATGAVTQPINDLAIHAYPKKPAPT